MRGTVRRLVSFAELDLLGDLLRKVFVPGGASDIECLLQGSLLYGLPYRRFGGPLRVLSKEVNASFVVLEFDCDEPSVGPDIIIFSAKRWRHNFRGEKGVIKGICNRQSVVLRLVLISRQYILCGRLKPRESD